MIQRRDFLKGTAAAVIFGVGQHGTTKAFASDAAVTYDESSVILKGRRLLISSGEVHYPRSTRAMWPIVLKRSKALGLNTIATYVFWNFHETSRGVFDFSGERDLGHFLDLCQQNELSVFLRVGPYICAEWNYGGYPPYLRDEPGITIRTMDRPYTARVEEYFHRLAEVVLPRLASNGGPVILLQVENEYANVARRYGENGQQYLRWIVELARQVGFATVPTTTCEGGAQGAIETSNGFPIPAERIAAVRKSHPGTPLLWTELYPAWYQVWGGRIAPARSPRGIAAAILDFVSRGGSGWNYYPWHGGTNFGRNSMYLQTPTYDFHAALDEYGCVTQSGMFLGRFHAFMQEHSAILFEGARSENVANAERTVTWQSNAGVLQLVQKGYDAAASHRRPAETANVQVRLLDGSGNVLFDLDNEYETVTKTFSTSEWKSVTANEEQAPVWQVWDEPLPPDRKDNGTIAMDPVEQLSLTKDSTDYCWYSAELHVNQSGQQEIVIPYGGDFFYVYIDSILAGSSKLPLQEDRGAITPDDPAHLRIVANVSEQNKEHGFRHSFVLPSLAAGDHRMDILAVALGMIKGDWQIASPMNFERKGIWEGVLLNGTRLQHWTMRPGLVGEKRVMAAHPETISWQEESGLRPLRWHKTRIDASASLLAAPAVFRLDAVGLGKGMIWVNGRMIGRHWLSEAASPPDTPSQRYYHVPADWLRSSNEIHILEEQAASPANVRLQFRA
jgi:hypothetical protein